MSTCLFGGMARDVLATALLTATDLLSASGDESGFRRTHTPKNSWLISLEKEANEGAILSTE
jgi:hypothetical protein